MPILKTGHTEQRGGAELDIQGKSTIPLSKTEELKSIVGGMKKNGAGNRIRTGDPLLGSDV